MYFLAFRWQPGERFIPGVVGPVQGSTPGERRRDCAAVISMAPPSAVDLTWVKADRELDAIRRFEQIQES